MDIRKISTQASLIIFIVNIIWVLILLIWIQLDSGTDYVSFFEEPGIQTLYQDYLFAGLLLLFTGVTWMTLRDSDDKE